MNDNVKHYLQQAFYYFFVYIMKIWHPTNTNAKVHKSVHILFVNACLHLTDTDRHTRLTDLDEKNKYR